MRGSRSGEDAHVQGARVGTNAAGTVVLGGFYRVFKFIRCEPLDVLKATETNASTVMVVIARMRWTLS